MIFKTFEIITWLLGLAGWAYLWIKTLDYIIEKSRFRIIERTLGNGVKTFRVQKRFFFYWFELTSDSTIEEAKYSIEFYKNPIKEREVKF